MDTKRTGTDSGKHTEAGGGIIGGVSMGKTITVRTETEKFNYVGPGFEDTEEFEITYINAISNGLMQVKANGEIYHVDVAFAIHGIPEPLRKLIIKAISELEPVTLELD